jgi:DNA invertase Pin-like site-specific DNA recombinase
MMQSQKEPMPYIGLAAPYNQIPDYTPDLVLPDLITALYTRLSNPNLRKGKKKDKDDDSNSIANQKLMLAKFAQEHQLPNPVFFTDDGISGTTFDRPDVQAALALVEAGRVKNFVVKDLSRFGRDRLKVDFYCEVAFPDLNVRFIALNDNMDSAKGENDMAPIRSMFNEWYARDTSRKVRAVLRAKGTAGEKLSTQAPYGYMKDPTNSKQWILDEPAAEVVRRIFRWCLAGLGPTHIANKLRAEQIPTPTEHMLRMGLKVKQKPSTIPCDWGSATIRVMLSRREYLGHTINFKTYRKSFKNKKVVQNAPEDQVVFENTHPAIIDQETFDRVQQLRSGKRRRSGSGRVELFSGLVHCADCGSRMYFSAGSSIKPQQDSYVCSGFRSKKVHCDNAHYIRAAMLRQMVEEYLAQIRDFAKQHEKAFVAHVMRGAEDKSRKAVSADKRRLLQMQRRITELDSIVQKLYEDTVFGKLSDERFAKLSQGYEQEQQELAEQVRNLNQQVDEQEQQSVNMEQFLRLIRRQTNVTELTPTVLHELIERIDVHAPDKSSGKRVQEITVHLSFIGAIGKLDILESETAGSAETESLCPQTGIAAHDLAFGLC